MTHTLAQLDGQTVLVRSAADRHNPPAAMRGTIRLAAGGAPSAKPARVEIVLDYPNMFTQPGHLRVLALDEAAVERLVASERGGVYHFEVEESLDPNSDAGDKVRL